MAKTVEVDTTASTLELYIALHHSRLPDIEASGHLSPSHVMKPDDHRCWVPLCMTPKDAVERATWGLAELGIVVADLKNELRLLKFTFTPHGFGHYFLQDILTARGPKRWRFHGDLPLFATNTHGVPLVQVGDDVMVVC